jgi:Domain of unknown function (DUF4412)
MRIFLFFLLVVIAGPAEAQFTGKLVYQLDQNGERTVMTYIQRGTSAIVETYTIKLNNGVTDTTTIQPQDTLIFDFAAGVETNLQFSTMQAYKTKFIGNMEAVAMAARLKGKASISVVSAGSASIDGYNCNHYVITSTGPIGSGARDVWTTGDIGGSPSLWIVGAHTYWAPGHPTLAQLTAAGASGVVVKANSSNAKQGLLYSMNLIYVDTNFKPRSPAYFNVPSRYNVVDETGYSLPGSGN